MSHRSYPEAALPATLLHSKIKCSRQLFWGTPLAGYPTHASAIAGAQAMEDQHDMLVDSLSTIGQQLIRGQSSALLTEQFARLAEFSVMHFGCEESLLRRHGYPKLEEHRRAHRDLMRQIQRAAGSAERGDHAELEHDLASVRVHYLEHVAGLDRDYSQWLHSRAAGDS
jgi:hemerythrin